MFLNIIANGGPTIVVRAHCYEIYVSCRKIDFLRQQTTFRVVLLYCFHGDRGHTAGEHVDRHDGQHLPEDRGDEKRMAETSECINIFFCFCRTNAWRMHRS